MSGRAFLGIDVGSSSIKVAITDIHGEILAAGSRRHRSRSPQPGWAEFDAEDVWRLIVVELQELAASHTRLLSSVEGVGMSVFCPGLVALDREGRALTGVIAFSDRRSVEDVVALAETLTAPTVFEVSGNRLMPGACSLTSMRWVQRARPDLYAQTYTFGHLNTYIGVRLTGAFGIDPSNASYTGLFETGVWPETEYWRSDIVAAAGIDEEKLPPIVKSHEPLGKLNNHEMIDLGVRAGIPVAMGGGDTACSALAVGAVRHNDLFESAGTSNVITFCSQEPEFDDRFMNRRHVIPGCWLYHGAMSSAGAALLWLRDEILQVPSDEVFAGLVAEAASLGAGHPIPLFLPYMNGERTPVWDPHATGVLFGLRLESEREHLVRAVLEGCAFGTRQILEIGGSLINRSVDSVVSIGGGSKVAEWTQLKADVTGRRFRVLDVHNAAVVGAAILAAVAAGERSLASRDASAPAISAVDDDPRVWRTFVSDDTDRHAYDARYKVYQRLYPALRELFPLLGHHDESKDQ